MKKLISCVTLGSLCAVHTHLRPSIFDQMRQDLDRMEKLFFTDHSPFDLDPKVAAPKMSVALEEKNQDSSKGVELSIGVNLGANRKVVINDQEKKITVSCDDQPRIIIQFSRNNNQIQLTMMESSEKKDESSENKSYAWSASQQSQIMSLPDRVMMPELEHISYSETDSKLTVFMPIKTAKQKNL